MKRSTGIRCNVRQQNALGRKSIHVICHLQEGERNGVIPIDPANGIYLSRCWILGDVDREKLPGGWLYLHDASYKMPHFSGIILDVKPDVNDQNQPGFSILFKRDRRGDRARWRGCPGSRRDYVRVVDARYSHELT